jgi:disulfide bond formation protein DsbB
MAHGVNSCATLRRGLRQIDFVAARAFGGAAFALGFEAAFARGPRGARGLARLGLVARLADEFEQALEGVGAIAVLHAKALRGDGDHALARSAAAGKCYQPRPYVVGQRRRMRGVEPQLYCGGDLVDVLTAGAGGAHELLFEFGILQSDVARDANHGHEVYGKLRAMTSTRKCFAAGFAICAGLLAFAYYLQYVEDQDPCPLCMVQRVAFYALGVVFLIGALHGPARRGRAIYGIGGFIVAALGAAVAARHVWLQHLPADRVPACGPDLAYMIKRFPLSEMVSKVLMGSGQCAEAAWKMLGLSIAEWSLLWLVLLGLFALYLALRKQG